MLRSTIIITAALLFTFAARAQTTGWVQGVDYDMRISLQTDNHQYTGHQEVAYTNNSPDTLDTIYYHLYFNAFQPNSMMAERNRNLPDPDSRVVPRIFNLEEETIGWHRVHSLTQAGAPLDFKITDTVLRAELAEPILPGETVTFEMTWDAQVPRQTRRSGWMSNEGIEYSMTQWYPKIAAYDRRGWHPDFYVGREFYAPFGTFDVWITAPAEYILGGTGVVQNPQDVGYGYGGTDAMSPGNTDADSLTWHFHAENVHDFAWAADPDYIHEEITGEDGIMYHLLYQPSVADQWEPMDAWTPGIIQSLSSHVGPYPWPQFTVIQGGDGGMEYPMITLITGDRSPGSLIGVTAHEAAHMWFYGIVANNEADYAWMDEGFASYLTSESVTDVMGADNPSHLGSYMSVLYAQDLGLYERLNTPADWFTTNLAYGVASYSAGAMFIEMLGYVIGDSLRDVWIHELYDRLKFSHPSPWDLERIAEDVSGLRLDWYFEQYLNTTRELDYAVEDVEAERGPDGWQTRVTLEREDEIVMPIDLLITYADGSTQWVNIPLGVMQGHKPVPEDWIVAEPWLWTSPRYTLELALPREVDAVEIDPGGGMPDYNRLNNTSYFPLQARFLQPAGQAYFEYSVGYRPLLQYADLFGFGGGMTARGQYLFGDKQLEVMLKLWPQVLFSENGSEPDPGIDPPPFCPGPGICPVPSVPGLETSRLGGIDYTFRYEDEVAVLGSKTRLGIALEKHLGFLQNELSLATPLTSPLSDTRVTLTGSILHQWNPTDRVFRLQALPVGSTRTGERRDLAVNPFTQQQGIYGRFGVTARSDRDVISLQVELGSTFAPTDPEAPTPFQLLAEHSIKVELNAVKTVDIGEAFIGEGALRIGLADRNLLTSKRFRLGGSTYEEQWRSAAFRSIAAAFSEPLDDIHLVSLRGAGPVAYLRPTQFTYPTLYEDDGGQDDDDDNVEEFSPLKAPTGNMLLAGGLRAMTQPVSSSPWLQPLRFGAFSGIGVAYPVASVEDVWKGLPEALLADAGLEVYYDVSQLRPLRRWVAQSDVLQGLDLVAKFPLWVSHPGLVKGTSNFAFRWLIGIETGI